MDNNFIVIYSAIHRETPFKRRLTSVSCNHILCILVAVRFWSAVVRGNSNLTREIYGSSRLLVTQMMELEIIPITGAMLSWSRLINHESSWVENQQHFLCFIYQLQLVLSSAAQLACRPGFLCRSVQLPKQGKKPKTGPNSGPHRPLQWKADGGFFWRQPAAVSSPGEETSHSVSSIIGSRRRRRTGGGQTDRAWHPTSGVFQTSPHWHIHGSPSNTHVKTHGTYMHSGPWSYLGSPLVSSPFINFILFSSGVTWQGRSCFCLWDSLWNVIYIISIYNHTSKSFLHI